MMAKEMKPVDALKMIQKGWIFDDWDAVLKGTAALLWHIRRGECIPKLKADELSSLLCMSENYAEQRRGTNL